jgi:hypothetical protein
MNITSGGLTIVAIGAIWFLVFLPSFIKADSNNASREKVESTSRDLLSEKLGDKASRAIRARRGRSVLATLTLVAFSVSTLSILEFATSGTGLSLAIGAGFAFVTLLGLTIRNHRNYATLVQQAVRRKIVYTRPALQVEKQAHENSSTTWQPVELPRQGFLKTGAIEIVDMADVVELEPRTQSPEVSSLDEIMRRRRHIG